MFIAIQGGLVKDCPLSGKFIAAHDAWMSLPQGK